jgi:hypothetical protein
MKENFLFIITIIVGFLAILSSLFIDYLFSVLSIFYLTPAIYFGIAFIVLYIIAISRKSIKTIYSGMIILGILSLTILMNSEFIKSKKLLEAKLMDDLSAIDLILREDNSFEVISSSPFTEKKYIGKYIIQKNKIIFLNTPFANDFIPDTVTIIENKIILRFDNEGIPNTDFANYFDIKINKLKNAP